MRYIKLNVPVVRCSCGVVMQPRDIDTTKVTYYDPCKLETVACDCVRCPMCNSIITVCKNGAGDYVNLEKVGK